MSVAASCPQLPPDALSFMGLGIWVPGLNIWVRKYGYEHLGPDIWVRKYGSRDLGLNIWVRIYGSIDNMGPNIWVPIYGSGYLGLGIWVWVYGSEHMGPGSRVQVNV